MRNQTTYEFETEGGTVIRCLAGSCSESDVALAMRMTAVHRLTRWTIDGHPAGFAILMGAQPADVQRLHEAIASLPTVFENERWGISHDFDVGG